MLEALEVSSQKFVTPDAIVSRSKYNKKKRGRKDDTVKKTYNYSSFFTKYSLPLPQITM